MADLIAIAYRDIRKAEEVLTHMKRLQSEYLVDLEDAAYVTKDEDGKVRLIQSVNIPLIGAVSGIAWGGLIGLLFLNPLLGAAIGAGSGAISGALSDYGINDNFMKELGKELQPCGSALFILARRFTPDRFVEEIGRYGGTVLKTSLTREAEQRLQQALTPDAGIQPAVQMPAQSTGSADAADIRNSPGLAG